jgi:hypothetical protein
MDDFNGTAQSRYDQLASDRQTFLTRARECATYTIPSLIPPDGASGATEYPTPYQSLGARGVNNLAGRLLMTLLPPNATFFRLTLDEELARQLDPQAKDAFGMALSLIEQAVLKEVEIRNLRPGAFESLKHLIVAGNVLVFITPKKGMRVFPLSQYVVDRDPEGNVLEIVVKETVSPSILPPEVADAVRAKADSSQTPEKFVDLYTHVERHGKSFYVYQQVKGITLTDSTGSYPIEKSPWLALRWTRIDGESYGRSHCDEYLGDLVSMEGLSKAILDAAQAAAKVVWLVNPNGTTDPADLEAPNNSVRPGHKDDVTALSLDKSADLQVARNTAEGLETRLSYAFLLNSAIQRNGERVTAEEIRYMANEIENAVGGMYSTIAEEFQLPLVVVLMAAMTRENRLPSLPDRTVHPTIITGFDALGRSQELLRLTDSLTLLAGIIGPQELVLRLNNSDLITRVFSARGVDPKGLVRDEAEVQQQIKQQQMMALAQKGIGPGIKAVSDATLQQNQQQQ